MRKAGASPATLGWNSEPPRRDRTGDGGRAAPPVGRPIRYRGRAPRRPPGGQVPPRRRDRPAAGAGAAEDGTSHRRRGGGRAGGGAGAGGCRTAAAARPGPGAVRRCRRRGRRLRRRAVSQPRPPGRPRRTGRSPAGDGRSGRRAGDPGPSRVARRPAGPGRRGRPDRRGRTPGRGDPGLRGASFGDARRHRAAGKPRRGPPARGTADPGRDGMARPRRAHARRGDGLGGPRPGPGRGRPAGRSGRRAATGALDRAGPAGSPARSGGRPGSPGAPGGRSGTARQGGRPRPVIRADRGGGGGNHGRGEAALRRTGGGLPALRSGDPSRPPTIRTSGPRPCSADWHDPASIQPTMPKRRAPRRRIALRIGAGAVRPPVRRPGGPCRWHCSRPISGRSGRLAADRPRWNPSIPPVCESPAGRPAARG